MNKKFIAACCAMIMALNIGIPVFAEEESSLEPYMSDPAAQSQPVTQEQPATQDLSSMQEQQPIAQEGVFSTPDTQTPGQQTSNLNNMEMPSMGEMEMPKIDYNNFSTQMNNFLQQSGFDMEAFQGQAFELPDLSQNNNAANIKEEFSNTMSLMVKDFNLGQKSTLPENVGFTQDIMKSFNAKFGKTLSSRYEEFDFEGIDLNSKDLFKESEAAMKKLFNTNTGNINIGAVRSLLTNISSNMRSFQTKALSAPKSYSQMQSEVNNTASDVSYQKFASKVSNMDQAYNQKLSYSNINYKSKINNTMLQHFVTNIRAVEDPDAPKQFAGVNTHTGEVYYKPGTKLVFDYLFEEDYSTVVSELDKQADEHGDQTAKDNMGAKVDSVMDQIPEAKRIKEEVAETKADILKGSKFSQLFVEYISKWYDLGYVQVGTNSLPYNKREQDYAENEDQQIELLTLAGDETYGDEYSPLFGLYTDSSIGVDSDVSTYMISFPNLKILMNNADEVEYDPVSRENINNIIVQRLISDRFLEMGDGNRYLKCPSTDAKGGDEHEDWLYVPTDQDGVSLMNSILLPLWQEIADNQNYNESGNLAYKATADSDLAPVNPTDKNEGVTAAKAKLGLT